MFRENTAGGMMLPDFILYYKAGDGGGGLVAQLCPTLCNPMDCSPPGSSLRGISQGRILKWIAISFSMGPSRIRGQTFVSCLTGGFFTTEPPWKPQ